MCHVPAASCLLLLLLPAAAAASHKLHVACRIIWHWHLAASDSD
jgi:hypothetical protein